MTNDYRRPTKSKHLIHIRIRTYNSFVERNRIWTMTLKDVKLFFASL